MQMSTDTDPLTIPALWRARVDTSPDSLAIDDSDRNWTVAEVDAHARGVAATVAELTPSDPVTVIGPNSGHGIATMLGVMMGGAAVAFLNDDTPADRRNGILDRLGDGPVILTPDCSVTVDGYENRVAHVQSAASADVLPIPDPDALAVIFFTSGSTGEPKGVMHSHRNMGIGTEQARDMCQIEDGDRVTLLYQLGFLASFGRWASALTGNNTSLWLRDVTQVGVDVVARELSEAGAEVNPMPPGIFRSLCTALGERTVPSAKTVVLGGDRVVAADLERCRNGFPGAALINNFGSSETMVMARTEVLEEHVIGGEGPPLGQVAWPWTVDIVDDDGNQVPDGTPGHMLVSGGPLTLGYWGDPELTARLVTENDAERSFRTGDLVVRDADGVLVHRGRADRRVKVHGTTVELSEVDGALERIAGIAEAAALGLSLDEGDNTVIAHVVLSDPDLTLRDVRRALQGTLTVVMMPTIIRVHDDLPRTERGKLDREALTPDSGEALALTPDHIKHLKFPEELIATEIISKVLRLDDIGVHDDFFELGGDSLGAMEVVVAAAERTGIEVPIGTFAERPTARGLAEQLRPGGRKRERVPEVRIVRPPVDGRVLVLVSGAGSTSVALTHLVRSIQADVGIIIVEQHALQSFGLPDRRVGPVTARVKAAIPADATRIALAGYSFGIVPALRAAREFREQGRAVDLVLSIDGRAPALPIEQEKGLGWLVLYLKQWGLIAKHVPRSLFGRRDSHYTGFWHIGGRARRLHREPSVADDVVVVRATDGDLDVEPWRQVCTGEVEVITVAGDHHSLLHPPFVIELAAAFDTQLERKLGATRSESPVDDRTPAESTSH